jgi:hypothetical protein
VTARRRRILWFAGLYFAGILAFAVGSAVLRIVLSALIGYFLVKK